MFTTEIEWEFAGSIWPEHLKRFELPDATDVPHETHGEAEVMCVLCRMHRAEPNTMLVASDFDRSQSALDIGLT